MYAVLFRQVSNSNKMDDFFLIEEPTLVFMKQDEFVSKTKTLLNKIADDYSKSWTSRTVRDAEYPEESICDKCTGCGTLTAGNGQTMDCVQDNGDCFIRFMDYEQFSIDVEGKLSDLYELLAVDAVTA